MEVVVQESSIRTAANTSRQAGVRRGEKVVVWWNERGRHYPLLIRDQFRKEKENNIDTTLESLDISFIAELLYSFIQAILPQNFLVQFSPVIF